jgi:hypothetical protein
MPTGTVQTILCVKAATGVDGPVLDALASVADKIAPSEISAAIDAFKAVPGVVEAIDASRADPDNLYVTTDSTPGRDRAAWPGGGSDVPMLPEQSVAPGISVAFDTTQNISLWDYDTVSDDDHLGSIMMEAADQGMGPIAKKASSSVEGSLYFVTYQVD